MNEPEGDRSLEQRFVRAELARRMFGSLQHARVAGYTLLRHAGAGGMGLVFEARDTGTGHRVALKALHHGDGALARLKREFRTLAALDHPHLLQLYQLCVEGEQPFLTMEFVDGVGLLEYIHRGAPGEATRRRSAMAQLVDAISALHRAGVAHRDLKPANIRVDPTGRLVVLDFGLVAPLGDAIEAGDTIAGTPLYTAPERMRGSPAVEASDWYSVGLILAETLGAPLSAQADGTLDRSALLARLGGLPASVPADLVRLAMQLLDEAPERRPDGASLRNHFGIGEPIAAAFSAPSAARDELLFVGREHELRVLERGLESARRGAFVVAYVAGAPGIGKTALVRQFLRGVSTVPETLVLSSRCYEREFIAFNAIDGLIDGLAARLAALPEARRRALRPPGAGPLQRLFPALQHVFGEVDEEPHHAPQPDEPRRSRERAFEALRELLARYAAGRTLVLHLDDLQWGDLDSAHALAALLRAPAPSPLLLIASHRSDAEPSPSLRALRRVEPQVGDHIRHIALGGLEFEPAQRLAAGLSPRPWAGSELGRLVRDANGSPLFLRLLVRSYSASDSVHDGSRSQLQALILAIVAQLPEPARHILQLVAIGGRPLGARLLLRAAEIVAREAGQPQQLMTLQRLGLLRRVQDAEPVLLDTFHDRVRETVCATVMAGERRRYHAALLEAAQEESDVDAEFLAIQCEGSGQFACAARYAELAGDRAFTALALQRSVRCYVQALRCAQGERPRELLRKLADASSYAGRSVEAARFYLELADGEGGSFARSLRLRAIELLMRAGLCEASLAAVQPLLAEVGLSYPASTPVTVHATLEVLERIGDSVFDARAVRREASELERLRIDLSFNLGFRLVIFDPTPAGLLLAQGLELALQCGDDGQLARALSCHALLLATTSSGGDREQRALLDRALQLARGCAEPWPMAWVLFFEALRHHCQTRWRASYESARKAQHWISRHLVDSAWLLQELEGGAGCQLLMLGEIAELDARSRPALERALDVGDIYLADAIRCHRAFVKLAHDDAHSALTEVDDVIRVWGSSMSCHMLATAMWPKLHALLYLGDAPAALALLRRHSSRLHRVGLARIAPWTLALPLFRATVALACASGRARAAELRAAQRAIAQLRRGATAFALALADLFSGAMMQARGRHARALALYAAAAEAFEAQGVNGYAAAARARQAALAEGSDAARLREGVVRFFAAQGILDGERWTAAFAPLPEPLSQSARIHSGLRSRHLLARAPNTLNPA